MDKNRTIESVRQAIGRGAQDEAFALLEAYFKGEGQVYKKLSRQSIVLSSQYNDSVEENRLGVISAEEFNRRRNQTNNSVLELVEELAESPPPEAIQSGNRRIYWYIGIALLLAAAFGLWQLSKRSAPPVPTMATGCPDFREGSKFKVLIIPFEKLGGQGNSFPAKGLRDNLGDFASRYRIDMDVDLLKKDSFPGFSQPSSGADAEEFANACQVDLVIWGSYESIEGQGSIINTRYKFFNRGNYFKVTELMVNEASKVDTVSSISSIATEGLLTSDIKSTIRLLLCMVATQTEQPESVISMVKDSFEGSDDMKVDWHTFLADAYVKTNNDSSAIKQYTWLINNNTNNKAWALENRGLLHYRNGKLENANADLERALFEKATDKNMLALLGEINLRTGHLAQARTYIQQAIEQSPNNGRLIAMQNELNSELSAAERRKNLAQQRLNSNPRDSRALRDVAKSELELGDNVAAREKAEKLLDINPRELEGYEIAIKAGILSRDSTTVREKIQQARKNGVPADSLIQRVPSLEEYFVPPPKRQQ